MADEDKILTAKSIQKLKVRFVRGVVIQQNIVLLKHRLFKCLMQICFIINRRIIFIKIAS